MTNEEKYKTAKERSAAFDAYCQNHSCDFCKLSEQPMRKEAGGRCILLWLAANAEMSIAEIVAAMRTGMVNAKTKEEAWNNREKLIALCDDLDAAAKRAYERIDGAMNKDMVYGESRLRELRSVLDETIGGYHG